MLQHSFGIDGKREPRRVGFALVELLVVIAIISLLVSILVPTVSRARELTKIAVCQSRLNGLGKGLQAYANNNDDYLIPSSYTAGGQNDWPAVLVWKEYIASSHSSAADKLISVKAAPFRCPSGSSEIGGGTGTATATYTTGGAYYIHTWYGLNASTDAAYPYKTSDGSRGSYRRLFDLDNVSNTVAAFDGASVHGGSSSNVYLPHLDDSANCVLMGGAVKRIEKMNLNAIFAGAGSFNFPAKFP